MAARRLLSLFLSVVLLSASPAHAACYFPDGSLSPNDTPCRDNKGESACCGQGYACLTNGICQATGEELRKPDATEFVRGSCTDKDWRSAACPSFCVDPNLDNLAGGMGLDKCPGSADAYWCVDSAQDDVDCAKQQNVLFFPGTPSAITTIGVAPATSTKPTTTSSSRPTDTTAAAPPPSGGDNRGAIIGGAVGGCLGALLLGVAGTWLFLRRRRRSEQPAAATATSPSYASSYPATSPASMPTAQIYAPVPGQPGTQWAHSMQPPVVHEADNDYKYPPQEMPS